MSAGPRSPPHRPVHRPAQPPSRRPAQKPAQRSVARGPARPPAPLTDREIDTLQALLGAVPGPLEPLDVVMLDGYLCGVLVQPQSVPAERWWAHVIDTEGRALPRAFDASRLRALVERRHAELDHAIGHRAWFDPWVFELDEAAEAQPDGAAAGAGAGAEAVAEVVEADNAGSAGSAASADSADAADAADDADPRPATAAVFPWVAGFALALESFPALMRLPPDALNEPLALLYRHLEPDDLEDADSLLAEIDALGPAADLAEAVEGLVRATLLLADLSRPVR